MLVIWKNIAEPGRPQMTIWCVRIAFCIFKATNTHTEYNTDSFSNATLVARTRLSVMLHVYCLSCSFIVFGAVVFCYVASNGLVKV
jgi:hypothetical protein